MREYIKKLQSKPEPVRKQIVVGLMITSMFFVAIVFVFSVRSTMSGDEKSTAVDNLAPFKLLGDSISDTYDNVSASVGKISLPEKQPDQDQSNEVSDISSNDTLDTSVVSDDTSVDNTNTVNDIPQYE